MVRISELLLSFVVNSAWQVGVIFVIASIGSYLLRNAPANLRHALWLIALGLSLIAPLLTITGFSPSFAPAVRILKSSPAVATPAVSNPAPNSGENNAGAVARLVARRQQVVNAEPRSFMVLAVGFGIFALLRVVRLARLWRNKECLRRSANEIALNPAVESARARCRDAFGRQEFALRRSDQTLVPVTLGARKPLIVLPAHFLELDEETLVSVIGHEVAHVSRSDYGINLICELAALPLSFHPLTYLIKREIERSREVACDELVTRRLLGPRAYARSLVRVANATRPHMEALALSILDGNILEERIMKLTRAQNLLSRGWGRAIAAAAIAALAVGVMTISNVSFDLRAYAQSSVASVFVNNARTAAPDGKSDAGSISSNAIPRSIAGQSNETVGAQDRARAACEAAQKRSLESIPTLIAMLGDDTKTELIRCWELERRWSPALDSFKHPSPGEQAALALASMGPPAFAPLAEALSSSNATVRRNAAWAIGELTAMLPGARASAVPRLIDLLGDSDAWTRMAAARALGELHDDRATERLVSALADADGKVRQLAAWALSEIKDSGAVNALCQVLLSDPDVDVRRTAAEALGEIRSTDALSALKQALNDPEARVRAKAGWAISEIEG